MKFSTLTLSCIISLIAISCGSETKENKDSDSVIQTTETTYRREEWVKKDYPKESFAYFLQHFPRKKGVYLWNGKEKASPESGAESLDIDVSQNQQCADAIIRLHAEWLWKQKRYNDIHYNLTNGFRMDYSKWAEGWRVKVNGNSTQWYKAETESDYSYKNFRDYLEFVFTYAGTASLDKELVQIGVREIEVGDVFILPGHPGHAVIVVDKELDYEYEKNGYYRIQFAQSYIPAQTPEIIIQTELHDRKPEFNSWMSNLTYEYSKKDSFYYFIDKYRFENSNIKTFKICR